MAEGQTFRQMYNDLASKTVNLKSFTDEIATNIAYSGSRMHKFRFVANLVFAKFSISASPSLKMKSHLFVSTEYEHTHKMDDMAISKEALAEYLELLKMVPDSYKTISSSYNCTLAAAIEKAWEDCDDLTDKVGKTYFSKFQLMLRKAAKAGELAEIEHRARILKAISPS